MSDLVYTITNNTVTVVIDGKSHSVDKSAPNYQSLRAAVLDDNLEEAKKHLTVGDFLAKWAKGRFACAGGKISFDGEQLPEKLNERIVGVASAGGDPSSIMRFWERLQKNPSWRSVNQLYPFLQHTGIPITEEGKLLAYKSVREDGKDHYSGKIDNTVGAIIREPRNKISDEPNDGCSFGLHVGALEYVQSFGAESRKIIICEVDPEHVVCVPKDSSYQKMRVCEYKVLGYYGHDLPNHIAFQDDLFGAPEDDLEDESDDELDDELGDEFEDDSELDGGLSEEFDDPEFTGDSGGIMSGNGLGSSPNIPEPAKGSAVVDVSGSKPTMDMLRQMNIGELRSYAAHQLKIVGASKIPGGKEALLAIAEKILCKNEVSKS